MKLKILGLMLFCIFKLNFGMNSEDSVELYRSQLAYINMNQLVGSSVSAWLDILVGSLKERQAIIDENNKLESKKYVYFAELDKIRNLVEPIIEKYKVYFKYRQASGVLEFLKKNAEKELDEVMDRILNAQPSNGKKREERFMEYIQTRLKKVQNDLNINYNQFNSLKLYEYLDAIQDHVNAQFPGKIRALNEVNKKIAEACQELGEALGKKLQAAKETEFAVFTTKTKLTDVTKESFDSLFVHKFYVLKQADTPVEQKIRLKGDLLHNLDLVPVKFIEAVEDAIEQDGQRQ